MKDKLKWIFTRWHFWAILVVFCTGEVYTNALEGFDVYFLVGNIIGVSFILAVIYFIAALIKFRKR